MDSVRKAAVVNNTKFLGNDTVVKAKILNQIKLTGVSCQKDIDQCNVAIGTLLEYTKCGWMVVLE